MVYVINILANFVYILESDNSLEEDEKYVIIPGEIMKGFPNPISPRFPRYVDSNENKCCQYFTETLIVYRLV